MSKAIAQIALPILRDLKAQEKAYEEEVNEWYSRGEGRSPRWITVTEGNVERRVNMGGSGYSFPACIHGTSRWTDYDNICGPCEDGASLYELALSIADQRYRLFNARLDRVKAATMNATDPLPSELQTALIDWACLPLSKKGL